MALLITRVRRLVGDPAGGGAFYADDTIQDALDEHRLDVRRYQLAPSATYVLGSAAQWLDYYDNSYGGNWEDDVTFQAGNFATLMPDTIDNLVGHWSWTLSKTPPVFLTGKTYDVYAAAAQLVEERAASVMLDFDVMSDRQTVARSQKHKMLLEQAKALRGKQRARNVHGARSDSVARARRAC